MGISKIKIDIVVVVKDNVRMLIKFKNHIYAFCCIYLRVCSSVKL